jgi:hypothetical protein
MLQLPRLTTYVPRTLASSVLNLGQFEASYTGVAEETRVSRELKKPRLALGGSLR